MVSSLKVSLTSPESEHFIFVLRTLESQLEYSAKLSRGATLSRQDSGALSEADLGVLLERMNATDEGDGGELCTIQVTTADDEVHTTADFPVKRLLEETIVGKVYDRLKISLTRGGPTVG